MMEEELRSFTYVKVAKPYCNYTYKLQVKLNTYIK